MVFNAQLTFQGSCPRAFSGGVLWGDVLGFGGNFPGIFLRGNVPGIFWEGRMSGRISGGNCPRCLSGSSRRITSLYVQRLWFVLPWLTHRQTDRQTTSDRLCTIISASHENIKTMTDENDY